MDSIYFGLSISFLVMALIAWRGYQKYKKPILWLGFMPILSVAHSFLGLYLLGLGFSFIGRENLIPYWVKFLSPTFIGVKFLGLPLEMLGLHDNLAYSIAFGLNAIIFSLLIIFLIQWLIKRAH